MPAKRKSRKARQPQPQPEPTRTDLRPVNLDEVTVAPAAPALPVDGPRHRAAGPHAAGAVRSGAQRGQRVQNRRYAFRRS